MKLNQNKKKQNLLTSPLFLSEMITSKKVPIWNLLNYVNLNKDLLTLLLIIKPSLVKHPICQESTSPFFPLKEFLQFWINKLFQFSKIQMLTVWSKLSILHKSDPTWDPKDGLNKTVSKLWPKMPTKTMETPNLGLTLRNPKMEL